MYHKTLTSIFMLLALCTLAAFASGCSSNFIYASDGTHSLHATVLAGQSDCDSASCNFQTWVLVDRGFFIFVDESGQIGVSGLHAGRSTRVFAPIISSGSTKIASNSIRTGLVTGLFPDLGISTILNSNLYLAKAEGDTPEARSGTRPTEAHFVAFIKGTGLVEGTLRENTNNGAGSITK